MRIALTSLCISGEPHIAGKLLTTTATFDSDLTSIRGLHIKLWAFKVVKVPILGISRLSFGSPKTKWHFKCWLVIKHIVYYKGKGGGFLQVGSWWILWIYVCSWLIRASKEFQLRINKLLTWFVQVCASNWLSCQSL